MSLIRELVIQLMSFRFAVNEKDLRPLIEDRGLDDVINDRKLFIVDYRILEGIKGVKNKTVRKRLSI